MSSPLSAARSGREAPSLETLHQLLHPDRLLPVDPETRAIARRLYAKVERPADHLAARPYRSALVCAKTSPFPIPPTLFVKPDHYVTRMLYSQGVTLEALGIPRKDGKPVETDPRQVWRRFAEHYHLFRGTPTRAWLDHAFATLFGFDERLSAKNADALFRPHRGAPGDARVPAARALRALQHRGDRDDRKPARRSALAQDDPRQRLERPRPHGLSARPRRRSGIRRLCRKPRALRRDRRRRCRQLGGLSRAPIASAAPSSPSMGATSTDHGHPSARTADLSAAEARALYAKLREGRSSAAEAELFRAQMLTEMAAMSLEDGLVMQLHPGSLRNHNPLLHAGFGRDNGRRHSDADRICAGAEAAARPLRQRAAASRSSCSRSTRPPMARELAPLAGHYPCLRLGPPWWFFDSHEGMKRFREIVTETAGFYNTVGFNDDTRAFCSIPARHDVARRVDCAYLAELVADPSARRGRGAGARAGSRLPPAEGGLQALRALRGP